MEKRISYLITLCLVLLFALPLWVLPALPAPTKNVNKSTSPNRSLEFIADSSILSASLTSQLDLAFQNLDGSSPVLIPSESAVLDTNFTIDNITINKIPVDIEKSFSISQRSNGLFEISYFQPLKVPASCVVPWVSIATQYLNPGNVAPNWTLSIYNAKGDQYNPVPQPYGAIENSSISFNPALEEYPFTDRRYNEAHWENVSLPGDGAFLNASQTYYHEGYYHFFVAISMPGLSNTHQHWFCTNKTETGGTSYGVAYSRIIGIMNELPGIDFTLRTELMPVDDYPLPSDIFLMVNGDSVVDVSPGRGIYLSPEPVTVLPGHNGAFFNITSSWSEYPGGAMAFDLDAHVLTSKPIQTTLLARVALAAVEVNWTAVFNVSFEPDPSFPSATLLAKLPLTWAINSLDNETGHPIVHETSPEPTGKYLQLVIEGLAPGMYMMTCISPLLLGDFDLDASNYGLDEMVNGVAVVPGGLNGENDTLRTDHEGRITSLDLLAGMANDTYLKRAQLLDNKSIAFYNTYSLTLMELLAALNQPLEDNVGYLNITKAFSFQLDETPGFSRDNIQAIELVLDQWITDRSIAIANITSIDVPDNPHWNINSIPPEELFWRTIFGDNRVVGWNLTFNEIENRYSDTLINYTSRVKGEDAALVDASLIDEIVLDIVTNFTFAEASHELHVRNQSSGFFMKLNSTISESFTEDQYRLYWNSSDESGMTNLTELLVPGSFTIEFMLRTHNNTEVLSSHVERAIDMALCSFSYLNTFSNITASLFNWTAGEYSNNTVTVEPEGGTSNLVLQFNETSWSDFYDNETSGITVFLQGIAHVPILNTIIWSVDRVMAVVTYTRFTSQEWDEAIFREGGDAPFWQQGTTTLFDSPWNNFTVSTAVGEFLGHHDDYEYRIVWSNGTDLAVLEETFSVDRDDLILSIEFDPPNGLELLEGDNYLVVARLFRADNGTAVEGKIIELRVNLVFRNGTIGTSTYSGMTGPEGRVTFSIELLPEWDSFYLTASHESNDPRLRSPGAPQTNTYSVLNAGQVFQKMLIESSPFIIIGCAAAVVVGLAYARMIAGKKRGWKRDADKIRDIIKIQHLMVIEKDSGACIVNRSYSRMQIDADLISGFLTAISSFSKEIGVRDRTMIKEESGIISTIFDYQDFKILMVDGKKARAALVLEESPTRYLKETLAGFVEKFEAQYQLVDWNGNLAMFNDDDPLIEEVLGITIILPLVVNPLREKGDVKGRLGKDLFDVAKTVQSEKGAFFLASLLAYAQAGRRASQDHVLAEIFRLEKGRVFEPYKE